MNKSLSRDVTRIYSLTRFLLEILGWLFAICSVGGTMLGNPDSVLNNLLAGLILSSIGAVILGVLSIIKKSKVSVLGILGALLGILLLLLEIFNGS